jgi:hypothetical protein
MKKGQGDLFKITLKIVAILCMVVIFSMIFHKAFADLAKLARQYSGSEFWVSLVRQLLMN